MFDIGDPVYHPVNGAGVIASLQRLPALKKGQRFYRIRMRDSTDTLLMVPVQMAEEIGLRPAIGSQEVKHVIQILLDEPTVLPDTHKRRYQLCEQKLEEADTMRTAEVVRDLMWRQVQYGHLNVPGQRIFKRAMSLLAGELAVAQGISLAEAEEQVSTILASQHQPA